MVAEAKVPGNIVFIKIPDSFARPIGDFLVDPAIPLPVELGRNAANVADLADLADLSWEMLVAGMLRFLAYQSEHEHAAYYRRFIFAVKPGIFNELSEAGILNARNKEFDIAEEIFLALCGLQPESAWPFVNLAVLHEDRADELDKIGKTELAEAVHDKAFAIYRNLLAADDPAPEACFNAAFFFLKQRNFDRAIELFEAYLDIGDDEAKLAKAREISATLGERRDRDILFKEAFDAIRLGHEADGLDKARRFVELDPGVWNGWFLAGWAQRRLCAFGPAAEAFAKALELGGDQVDICNELAICELELGRLDDSRRHLEQALRLETDNVKILSNLGVVARRQGRLIDAAGFFRIVLDLDPSDRLARQQLAELPAGASS